MAALKSFSMKYTKASYLYPPRPSVAGNPEFIDRYDNGTMWGSIKYNGSAAVVLCDNGRQELWNRHKQRMKGALPDLGLTGVNVICGEWLNKSQLGEYGLKTGLVIWDILVFDGEYLIGDTYETRLRLINELWQPIRMGVDAGGNIIEYKYINPTGVPELYTAATWEQGFAEVFDQAIKFPLVEGFILKKRDAALEYGFTEMNNTGWQVKFRKPTKNYVF